MVPPRPEWEVAIQTEDMTSNDHGSRTCPFELLLDVWSWPRGTWSAVVIGSYVS